MRIVPEQWSFGCYTPATKEGSLLPVLRRNAATLMSLIIQWVRLRIEISNNMWGAYSYIVAQGFQYDVVNHQYNFEDPNTKVTTNHVEATWQLKQNLNQCSTQQIVTWFQITWQSSCETRDSRNILIFTFGLKLLDSTLYELHSKKQLF